MQKLDAVIIGAGPAGISSALKCVENGYNTLVIEKNMKSKPCGGLAPLAVLSDLKQKLNVEMPLSLFSSPKTLGLFYVAPSGKKGFVKGYKILNLERHLFDEWLRLIAKNRNIKILFNAEFIKLQEKEEGIEIFIKNNEKILKLKTGYLIGADGVLSKVRSQIYPSFKPEFITVLQEHWSAKGDFDEFFYMIFKKSITLTYGYVIPKNNLFIIGTGAPKNEAGKLQFYVNKFKEWLKKEFYFKPLSLKKRELGFIPCFKPIVGERNIALIGDAGGFCNPFSGEGIRLAIESGASAGEALKEAEESSDYLAYIFKEHVEDVVKFISRILDFTLAMNDESIEEFVSNELARNWVIEEEF
ncbi:MAG: NAD(P)/FAD-dependent oxidoreductase [Candidatus Bathyarchaeia archaeon]